MSNSSETPFHGLPPPPPSSFINSTTLFDVDEAASQLEDILHSSNACDERSTEDAMRAIIKKGLPPPPSPEPPSTMSPKKNGSAASKSSEENMDVQTAKTMKRARIRAKAVQEFISTERTYVNLLSVLIQNFVEPLKTDKIGLMSEADLHTIFPTDIHSIYNCNKEFLQMLEEHTSNWDNHLSRIGPDILAFVHYFKMYQHYCNNHEKASEVLSRLNGNNSKFVEFCSAQQLESPQNLNLEALLILPIQRIPRYKMLLTEILKNTESDHCDLKDLQSALSEIKKISHILNEKMKDFSSRQSVLKIKRRFDDSLKLIAPARVFIKEGPLFRIMQTIEDSRECVFFLFSDVVVYGFASFIGGGDRLKDGCILPFDRCFAVEETDLKCATMPAFAFEIYSSVESFIVYASDETTKKHWMSDIQDVCDAHLSKEKARYHSRHSSYQSITNMPLWSPQTEPAGSAPPYSPDLDDASPLASALATHPPFPTKLRKSMSVTTLPPSTPEMNGATPDDLPNIAPLIRRNSGSVINLTGNSLDFPDVCREELFQAPRMVPDDFSGQCMTHSCDSQFSLFNRRHHCYYCGFLVCNQCSAHKLPNRHNANQLLRVCDVCYDENKAMASQASGLLIGDSPVPSSNISAAGSDISIATDTGAKHKKSQSQPPRKNRASIKHPAIRVSQNTPTTTLYKKERHRSKRNGHLSDKEESPLHTEEAGINAVTGRNAHSSGIRSNSGIAAGGSNTNSFVTGLPPPLFDDQSSTTDSDIDADMPSFHIGLPPPPTSNEDITSVSRSRGNSKSSVDSGITNSTLNMASVPRLEDHSRPTLTHILPPPPKQRPPPPPTYDNTNPIHTTVPKSVLKATENSAISHVGQRRRIEYCNVGKCDCAGFAQHTFRATMCQVCQHSANYHRNYGSITNNVSPNQSCDSSDSTPVQQRTKARKERRKWSANSDRNFKRRENKRKKSSCISENDDVECDGVTTTTTTAAVAAPARVERIVPYIIAYRKQHGKLPTAQQLRVFVSSKFSGEKVSYKDAKVAVAFFNENPSL